MAEDDNFDIDIYGDDEQDTADFQQTSTETQNNTTQEENADREYELVDRPDEQTSQDAKIEDQSNGQQDKAVENGQMQTQPKQENETNQEPTQQGVKRKEGHDDRPVDAGASSAVVLSELQWWTNDDDIRGWANQCGCEDEIREVTFSEHKVNGKSKGQAYIEFSSPQAATAMKAKVEASPAPGSADNATRRHVVNFTSPATNPFRTLPKDAPTRGGLQDGPRGGRGNFAGDRGGFRGRGRGGNFGRGGGFQGATGQMNGAVTGNAGFQGANMGGFGGAAMGGMNNFGNFNRGGNMMMGNGMRGRGAMGMAPVAGRGGNVGMMGMGGMPMYGMGGMGMGMPANFAGGAQQGHFNPAFFQGAASNQQMGMNAGAGTENWNPHGAKRARPE